MAAGKLRISPTRFKYELELHRPEDIPDFPNCNYPSGRIPYRRSGTRPLSMGNPPAHHFFEYPTSFWDSNLGYINLFPNAPLLVETKKSMIFPTRFKY